MTRVFSDGKRHRFLENGPGGVFRSKLTPWTPEKWDECWVNKGRALVFRPDYPRARKYGHTLRAHVVWWLATGQVPPRELRLHHKNHDKLDDRLENLELLTESQHMSEHRRAEGGRVELSCFRCGTVVSRERNRIRYERSFCSYACYAATPKSSETRLRHSRSRAGDRHPMAKLTVEKVREIRSSKLSDKDLAEKFSVHPVTIRHARSGRNWSCA